jgi:hypothetical protein
LMTDARFNICNAQRTELRNRHARYIDKIRVARTEHRINAECLRFFVTSVSEQ